MPEFQNMLSGLMQELGAGGAEGGDMDNIFKNLEANLKSENQPGQEPMENNQQFENFANSLLNEFMDKEIIYEPLKDA